LARSELLHSLSAHLAKRGAVRAFVATVAVAVAVGSQPPPQPTLEGLSQLLAARSGARVDPESIVWEPSRSVLAELVLGRRVMFLASAPNGGPRDVYRAAVRLTPNGEPLAAWRLTNLSDTPDADELGLALEGGVATFVTVASGAVRAVTAFHTNGAELERTDVIIAPPAREATLVRDAASLTLRLAPHDDEVRYDFARRTLASAPGVARAVPATSARKGVALALGDAARRGLGATFAGGFASLGRRVRDTLERAFHALAPGGGRAQASGAVPKAHVAAAKDARRSQDVWPPPKVPSRFAPAEPGEGVYQTLVADGPEPCVLRTFVRPDASRPYARAVIVALDMRTLELGLIAGSELPRASAGPPGSGRLASDSETLERLVAVFGGGPTTEDVRFGMAAGGRVLVPPEPGGIAIAVLAQGETLLGPWPFGRKVPPEVVAFRQGLSALLEPAATSPSFADGDVRPRSGLCATPAGHLHYAFGARLDRKSLASALAQSGCAYAVELGGGGEPAGMAIARGSVPGAGSFTNVDPAMTFDAGSAFAGSSRDFLTLSRRDMTPRLPKDAVWRPAPGTQPAPSDITGIFSTKLALGGLSLELYSFEPGRVEWRLRPGPREPGARGEAWAGVLPDGAAERALAVLELGHTTVTPKLGLALGATTPITLKDVFATLVLAPTEPPRILAPGETTKLRAEEQAVQLPLLADTTGLTERARERGDLRQRAALGVTRGGRVLVGLLRHDSSDPLAVALKDAGAERVVELDRGSHHPAFVERAGTDHPPAEARDSTTLWALGRPMLPGARVAR
jgi:hypothetical protein